MHVTLRVNPHMGQGRPKSERVRQKLNPSPRSGRKKEATIDRTQSHATRASRKVDKRHSGREDCSDMMRGMLHEYDEKQKCACISAITIVVWPFCQPQIV